MNEKKFMSFLNKKLKVKKNPKIFNFLLKQKSKVYKKFKVFKVLNYCIFYLNNNLK